MFSIIPPFHSQFPDRPSTTCLRGPEINKKIAALGSSRRELFAFFFVVAVIEYLGHLPHSHKTEISRC